MNRIALVGAVALVAACDIPLVMIEVEAPSTCVLRVVDLENSDMAAGVAGVDELPSEMAVNVSGSMGTTFELDDNLVDLPEEAKDMLDLDVQIQRVRIQALDPYANALDGVNTVSITVVPPDGSGLAPKTLLAYDRATAGTPPGGAIEAGGQEINLAEYLYSGQLRFTYTLDATILQIEPWQMEVETCVSTRGYVGASVDDLQGL